ncbi:MAG: redoxin domain-containing protein [Chloroflexota bacterium]
MHSDQTRTQQRLIIILIGMILAILVVGTATAILFFSPVSPQVNLSSANNNDGRQIEADGPVATVNGVVITTYMLDREVNVSRFNIVEPLPPLQGDDLQRARNEALNQLTTRQLILQAAAQQNYVVSKEQVEERVRLLYGTYGDEKLSTALKAASLDDDDLFWWVSELLTVEAFTVNIIMEDASPETRQQVYNEWLNQQQAQADVQTFLEGQAASLIALPGNPAPDFALQTIAGETVSLSQFRGKVVLVNFWATWCPSCIAELPAYEQVYAQQPLNDFVVLGVNLQENAAHVEQYSQGLGLSFPILLDRDGQVTIKNYQVVGMPGSIIVDRQGNVFYRHIGPMSADVLREKLSDMDNG